MISRGFSDLRWSCASCSWWQAVDEAKAKEKAEADAKKKKEDW
jgi:hypothetical protein